MFHNNQKGRVAKVEAIGETKGKLKDKTKKWKSKSIEWGKNNNWNDTAIAAQSTVFIMEHSRQNMTKCKREYLYESSRNKCYVSISGIHLTT